jgi:hypothetical protein
MSLSDTFETTTLKWLLTADAVTRPTAWYIGLFTAAPSDAGGGTEVSGGSYARKSVAFTVSGNLATNSAAVEFDVATADWGTITSVAVFDAVSGGNMIAYATLTASKTIANGDVLRIPLNDLDITMD